MALDRIERDVLQLREYVLNSLHVVPKELFRTGTDFGTVKNITGDMFERETKVTHGLWRASEDLHTRLEAHGCGGLAFNEEQSEMEGL